MLKFAWHRVKSQTIANCFRYAGFIIVPGNTEEFLIEILEGRAENQILDEFHNVLPQGVTFGDYSSVDDGIIPIGVMTDGDIVDSLANVCEGLTLDEFEKKKTLHFQQRYQPLLKLSKLYN